LIAGEMLLLTESFLFVAGFALAAHSSVLVPELSSTDSFNLRH
jgi:hypothetical protein